MGKSMTPSTSITYSPPVPYGGGQHGLVLHLGVVLLCRQLLQAGVAVHGALGSQGLDGLLYLQLLQQCAHAGGATTGCEWQSTWPLCTDSLYVGKSGGECKGQGQDLDSCSQLLQQSTHTRDAAMGCV